MNQSKLGLLTRRFNYTLSDSDVLKFFDDLKLLISQNESINEIWHSPCLCHKDNNLLFTYCSQPKIIEKLLILGANPNTLLNTSLKENTTFYVIIDKFIREYQFCCVHNYPIIELSRICETVLHLLNYGGDLNKFTKSNSKDIKMGLNSFLITYYETFIFGFNKKECLIFLVDFLKNVILKLDKKYLEDTVSIIPFDLVQHCIFSLDLKSFRQFLINENDLGNLTTECIQSTKKFKSR